MRFVAVMPVIHEPTARACWDTMSERFQAAAIVVDNTVDNRGVAGSWNVGVDAMLAGGADWLVIVSAGVRFCRPDSGACYGGDDFLDALDAAEPSADAIEAADGIGWHLIAFRRETLEAVGRFDEIFWPAYMEDIDWGFRYHLWRNLERPIRHPFWPKVPVAAWVPLIAHGVVLGGVHADPSENLARYAAKWGGVSGSERFTRPYDHPALDWTFTGHYQGATV